MQLTTEDREMLSGERGDGVQFAMHMITRVAEVYSAERLIDISWAHVASAYDHSQANLDFALRLARSETKVAIPTTLTACSLNLRHPRSGGRDASVALQLIELYKGMGCNAVMTCAPYHTGSEPGLGENIAWCESSAVVYANSVLGARTNRYVEFLDMAAAVTGRVPDCGLHKRDNRRATMLVRLSEIPDRWLRQAWFFHALGVLTGRQVGDAIPALDGLPADTDIELLRAFGAAAATSGSLSMFHAIGITPEAATREQAFQGVDSDLIMDVTEDAIRATATGLSRNSGEALTAVCLGAPHFSRSEFENLISLLDGRRVSGAIRLHASTSSAVLAELERAGLLDTLLAAGVNVITGRCTYYRPLIDGCDGHVMTNSAKWAYYAPAGLGASVTFASLEACVESACAGRIVDVVSF
jgi:hypothetical protein